MDEILKRDQNFVTVLGGITDDSDQDIRMLRVDPITKRLLVKATGIATGVTSINGLTGAVILAAGTNITLTPVGNTITIASSAAGVSTIGTIDSQAPSANGAVISGTSLYMQSASTTVPGLVNTTTQGFAGRKTISNTFVDIPVGNAYGGLSVISNVNNTGAAVAYAVYGINGNVEILDDQIHTSSSYVGGGFSVNNNASATLSTAFGAISEVNNNALGSITTAVNYSASIENADAGTITSAAGYVSEILNSGAGTIATGYNFRVFRNEATTKYGFYNDVSGTLNRFTTTSISETYTSSAASRVALTSLAEIDFTGADSANNNIASVGYLSIIDSQTHANGLYFGLYGQVENTDTAVVTNAFGVSGAVSNSLTGTIQNAHAFVATVDNDGGGTITTSYGYKVAALAGTTQYGFYNDFAGSLNVLTQTHIISGLPVRFYDTDNSHYTGLKANGTTTASVEYTLPAAGPASNGYALVSTTAGVMSWANASTFTIPINNLLAATGTNTIDNAAFAQEWQWNSLTTQTGLGLSSSSNTSGVLLSLSSTSTAVTTNTGLLNVSYSGTPSTSSQTTYAIYANNNVVGNTSQTRYGVRGGVSGGTLFAGGGNGVGGLFTSSVTGTTGYGVQGTVSGQLASGAYGVYGSSTATSTAGAHGVYGISTGSSLGYGTYGSASATTGTSYGSYGIATTTLNNSASFGGRFRAVANTSGSSSVSYGVYGEAVTTGTGGTAYGGYFTTTGASATNIAGYFTASGGTNNYAGIFANGSVGIGITAPTAFTHIVQPVVTTGSPTAFLVTGGAHTTLTASTEAIDININLNRTVQFATGALTTQRAMVIQAPAYGFVGSSTITTAATLAITGAPARATNSVITNTHALLIQAGAVGTASNSYGLTVNAQTGATTNYAAAFLGGRLQVGNATTSIGSLMNMVSADTSGTSTTLYGQATNSASQFSWYVDNDRGSFASYGGWLYGGSTNAAANLFGVNRQDKFFLFSDGASNLGMYTGTLNATSYSVGTNNAVRFNVNSSGRTFFGGTTSATALVHIAAGTTAASTAPLKFTTGPLNTTAEAGTREYNNFHYQTNNAGIRMGIGGIIVDNFADVSVGGAETDIYTYTTVANTFAADGSKIIAQYGGNFVTVGTELTQLKVYFGGTAIWDSTGVAPSTGTTSWRVYVEIIRVSATVVRYTVSLNTTGASGYVYCMVGELTGLTLSGTNILKITGTSTGVGSGTGDILGRMNYMRIDPPASL